MSTQDQIDALLERAEQLRAVAEAEKKAADAKAAYRSDKSEKNKKRHNDAAQALTEARQKVRAAGPIAFGDGSVTIQPATVQVGTSVRGK